MEYKKYIKVVLIILIIILLVVGITDYFFGIGGFQENEKGFEIDTLFLKVAIEENGTAIRTIKIKNLDAHEESCDIKINEINDLIILSNNNFQILPGEEVSLGVEFNIINREPEVYLGELEVSSVCKNQKIPIILEIESDIVIFDSNVNLYPQGRDVIPGQKINANIRIFDLASFGKSQIKVIYSFKSFDGRTITSETEDLVVDEEFDYSKTIDIPENIRLGDYAFTTVIKYTDDVGDISIGTSSVIFKVVEEESEKIVSNNTLIWVVIIFGSFFLIFLGLFIYSLLFRDKVLREIQSGYKRELRKQRQMIEGKVKIDSSKLKTFAEKKEYKKEINKVKKQRINALKTIQKKKVKEFKIIKKKYKGSKRKNQLVKWKKQGYNINILEKKYKLPNVNNIKAKVKEWKKKGYNTGVLEKK